MGKRLVTIALAGLSLVAGAGGCTSGGRMLAARTGFWLAGQEARRQRDLGREGEIRARESGLGYDPQPYEGVAGVVQREYQKPRTSKLINLDTGKIEIMQPSNDFRFSNYLRDKFNEGKLAENGYRLVLMEGKKELVKLTYTNERIKREFKQGKIDIAFFIVRDIATGGSKIIRGSNYIEYANFIRGYQRNLYPEGWRLDFFDNNGILLGSMEPGVWTPGDK